MRKADSSQKTLRLGKIGGRRRRGRQRMRWLDGITNSMDMLLFQSFSHLWLFETPWTAAYQASLSITNSCSLLKLMFIESMIPASVFPMNIQGWFPLGLTGLISLLFKGLSIVFPSTTVWKHQFFGSQPSLRSNSHIRTWLLEKTIALTIQAFTSKVVSLLFNTLSRFAIASFPKNKCLLISWLQ